MYLLSCQVVSCHVMALLLSLGVCVGLLGTGAQGTLGFATASFGNSSYSYFNIPSTWTDASNYCLALEQHLVSCESEQEWKDVHDWGKQVKPCGGNCWTWLGAKGMGANGGWKWVTGTPISTSNKNWDDRRGFPKQPNARKMVGLVTNLARLLDQDWTDTDLWRKTRFICEKLEGIAGGCEQGYRRILDKNAFKCQDVDECSSPSRTRKQPQKQLQRSDPCFPYPCKNGGICEKDGINQFKCKCLKAFTGKTCETWRTPCDQICANTEGSFTCDCKEGYKLAQDRISCVDVDECAGIPNPCQHGCENRPRTPCNHICTNTVGSYKCGCDDGYAIVPIDANRCKDIDECEDENGGCGHICTNTEGGYDCSCESGYRLGIDKKTCSDIEECEDKTLNKCDHICRNTDGAYTCDCNQGYIPDLLDMHRCMDVDECAGTPPPCQHQCDNLPGSFRCICPTGFLLKNTTKCVDVDECEQNSPCDHICTNTVGSYKCGCDDGYATDPLDANRCSDVDECGDKNGGCDHICTNTKGSYDCSCRPNFALDASKHKCKDVNECKTGLHNCDHHCDDLEDGAGFRCRCGPGYTLKNKSQCVDDDECKLGSHECEHICSNTIGSYDCSCLNGYKLGVDGKVCVNIDECLEREEWCKTGCQKECKKTIQTVIEIAKKQNKKVTLIEIIDKTCITNCEKECLLCEDICTNTDGGYECGCSKGYTLDANNKTCSDKDECKQGLARCEHRCRNLEGSFECYCDEGFRIAEDGEHCDEIDECSENADLCEFECLNLIAVPYWGEPGNFYICVCPTGKKLNNTDKKSCIDVDECAETPSVCDQICNNTEGSYFCSCQIGYSLVEADKKSCQDIDECTHQEKFKFVKHLCEDKCQNTLGSYQCSCSKGYSLDANNRNCSDIDECKQDDVCEATAECNNTLGNYTCICKSGYSKDIEKNCIDEDECKDPKVAARCGTGGECVNNPGSYACDCKSGYELDQLTGGCVDIDECSQIDGSFQTASLADEFDYADYAVDYADEFDHPIYSCPNDTTCTNLPGTYECYCKTGFRKKTEADDSNNNQADDLSDLKLVACTDVDECSNGEHECDDRADCHNLEGFYECICKDGYKNISFRECEDVNECEEANPEVCPKAANLVCKNMIGTYKCICREGYQRTTNNFDEEFTLKKVCTVTPECKTPQSDEYAGTKNVTLTGKPCLHWISTILQFGFRYLKTKEAIWAIWPILKGAGNACRNPDADNRGPWCYVEKGTDTQFEYCDIPDCPKECIDSSRQSELKRYQGSRSISKTGKDCLNWRRAFAQFPMLSRDHTHHQKAELSRAQDFCRFDAKLDQVACLVDTTSRLLHDHVPVLEECDVQLCQNPDDFDMRIPRMRTRSRTFLPFK